MQKNRRSKPGQRLTTAGSSKPLDYADYDTDENNNLIFYGQQEQASKPTTKPEFDFNDVIQSIKNNETGVEVAKKLFSAAATLTERADSSPVQFMMWTVPTTLLALMGVVYMVGAVAIVGYKYLLFFSQGDSNQAINLLPVIAVVIVPLIIAFFIVTTRSSLSGELNVNRLMRGELE